MRAIRLLDQIKLVLLVVLLICITWFLQFQFTKNTDLIKYENLIRLNPIKSFSTDYASEPLAVYLIGSIEKGSYDNYYLAMVSNHFDSAMMYEQSDNMMGQPFVYPCTYFISDDKGNVVAWDDRFFSTNYYCTSALGENLAGLSELFGFQPYLYQNLSQIIPSEFSNAYTVNATDGSKFTMRDEVSSLENFKYFKIGVSQSGWEIYQSESWSDERVIDLTTRNYVIRMPYEQYINIEPEPDFLIEKSDIPDVVWNDGSQNDQSFYYGINSIGYWEDCFNNMKIAELDKALEVSGTNANGLPVYELHPKSYPKIYECLYEKYQLGVHDQTSKLPYVDFVKTHPMFFWKHSTIGIMPFIRTDLVAIGGKAKPVIYLYPEQNFKIQVHVDPIGGFLKTDPYYGNGWLINAFPDGTIFNIADNKTYPYLFWEGKDSGGIITPQRGFVAAREDLPTLLEAKLKLLGLNKIETRDFLDFWIPKLSKSPYYFITFISKSEIDRTAPLNITPRPDTTIRILMDYRPLKRPINVLPLNISTPLRYGFTVVEWGGINRDFQL